MSSHSLRLLHKQQALQDQVELVKQRYRAEPEPVESVESPLPVPSIRDFQRFVAQLLYDWAFPPEMPSPAVRDSELLFVYPNPRKETNP